ncbi:MAG: hypothetical protein ACFE8L_10720, partial [Candidatus Hodarchaeota archaeon]
SKFYNLKNKNDKKQEGYVLEDLKSFCKSCGKEIKSNSEYCGYCSANLGEKESFERLRAYIKRIYEEEQKQKVKKIL